MIDNDSDFISTMPFGRIFDKNWSVLLTVVSETDIMGLNGLRFHLRNC